MPLQTLTISVQLEFETDQTRIVVSGDAVNTMSYRINSKDIIFLKYIFTYIKYEQKKVFSTSVG